jgi:hypothetical protein
MSCNYLTEYQSFAILPLAILPDSAIKKLIFEKAVSFCFHWRCKDNKKEGKSTSP